MYLCSQIIKTKQDMEVISIERSTYEELLTSFNSFVIKMKEMASRGNDKGMGDQQSLGQAYGTYPSTCPREYPIFEIRKELGLHHCRPNSHSNKRIKWKKEKLLTH